MIRLQGRIKSVIQKISESEKKKEKERKLEEVLMLTRQKQIEMLDEKILYILRKKEKMTSQLNANMASLQLRNREKQRGNDIDCEIFRKKMMLQDNSLFQSSIKLSNASRCSSSSYHQQCHNG